jgi:hypothetical protein
MAKQKATNQPITAEEPIRPDEQFRLDESEVAPPSARPIGAKTTVAGSNLKSYGARSARERRAASGSGQRPSASARRSTSSRRSNAGPRADIVNNMLEHPTIEVTEAQLREEYAYVRADLRSMFLTSAALIAALVVLANILPK